jgi:8-oxo-dGTP pyrophosphatase MutT (NUDIX family)
MERPQPAPGEELNFGPETVPRVAATVIVLRDAADGPEVLLVRRNPASRFMGGAWVFPGGAVSRDEGEGEAALRAAALRECQEEAGITLGAPDELVVFSRWITPAQVKTRFDTWFFLAPAPAGQEPRPDGAEIVAVRWITPAAALEELAAGELFMVFPTIKHLERLRSFRTASELLDYARRSVVVPVEPRVIGSGEMLRVVLPGEPGYED